MENRMQKTGLYESDHPDIGVQEVKRLVWERTEWRISLYQSIRREIQHGTLNPHT